MLLSASYGSMRNFSDEQQQESIAIAKLAPLATDRMLSGDQRLQMLQVVGELDRINDMLVTDSRDFLGALKEAHLGFDDANVQKEASDVLTLQRGYRGACVRKLQLHLD